MLGTYTLSIAQTTSKAATTSTSKQDKAAIAAQKKADKEAKEAAKKQAKEAKATANTQAAADKKAESDKKKADKALAKKQASEAKVASAASTNAGHLNKNGTPDKRFKANKQVNPSTTAQTPAPTKATPAPKIKPSVAHTSTPKSADKQIGKDAKGRTLYMGPRGGKYYLTANGNKEYVK